MLVRVLDVGALNLATKAATLTGV